MAFWAKAVFLLGIAQLILSAVGIIYIRRSLDLNKSAVDAAVAANENTVTFAKADLRPWVKINIVNFERMGLEAGVLEATVNCEYENIGRSPAVNVVFDLDFIFEEEYRFPWYVLGDCADAFGRMAEKYNNTLFPLGKAKHPFRIQFNTNYVKKPAFCYVFLRVMYEASGFPGTHKTCRLYEIRTFDPDMRDSFFNKIDFRPSNGIFPAIDFRHATMGDYAD
jgi:hypothetical protein